MNKREIPEIMRKQYDAFYSKDGIDYKPFKLSMFDIVHICDYHYRDLSDMDKKKLTNVREAIRTPVFFHHNDYWIVDGNTLAWLITRMTLIHKRDWRKVVNNKWRLQPDWLKEWHNSHSEDLEVYR